MPTTYSPLRYPGGKSQLSNFVLNLLRINDIQNCTYIEPYSGGFGLGLRLLMTDEVDRVVINDYDKSIYSVWYSILYNTDNLIELIENTPVTIDSWHEQKEIHNATKNYRNSLDNGFSTLFLNRTNRSGIINAGPIGGYNQNGKYKLDCRFTKKTLINKILDIANKRDRIDLFQKDAILFLETIKESYSSESTFVFLDPPYYVQGKNLYTNFYQHSDHEKLAEKMKELNDYFWITTYDFSPQIHCLYSQNDYKCFSYDLLYSAQQKKIATEFIFASAITNLISHDKVTLQSIK